MRKARKKVLIWVTWRGLIRWLTAGFALLLIVAILDEQLKSDRMWSPWGMPLSGKVVVIDPGHGGPDGGAVSKGGVVEKDINLSIALLLRDFLQESGAVVIMTRERDIDLAEPGAPSRKTQDLHRRVERVSESDADFLVSIHMNAIASPKWHGAQTFYDPNSVEQSKQLAKFIQKELIENLENTNRAAKSVSNIYLLKSSEIPAVLVEAGFLSNAEEARRLSTEKYQNKVAASIYRGILRFASGEKME